MTEANHFGEHELDRHIAMLNEHEDRMHFDEDRSALHPGLQLRYDPDLNAWVDTDTGRVVLWFREGDECVDCTKNLPVLVQVPREKVDALRKCYDLCMGFTDRKPYGEIELLLDSVDQLLKEIE